MEDAVDLQDEDAIEEESEAEVNRVLFEVTKGVLGEGPAVPADKGKAPALVDDEVEPELESMQARLAALSSSA